MWHHVIHHMIVSQCALCPCRAGLLTGRYQTRSGIYPGVFDPTDLGGDVTITSFSRHILKYWFWMTGLPFNETTIAEGLKEVGYSSGIVGKWHLVRICFSLSRLYSRHAFSLLLSLPLFTMPSTSSHTHTQTLLNVISYTQGVGENAQYLPHNHGFDYYMVSTSHPLLSHSCYSHTQLPWKELKICYYNWQTGHLLMLTF